MKNSGDEPLTMYLVNEPTPDGFRPNKEILIRDEKHDVGRRHYRSLVPHCKEFL